MDLSVFTRAGLTQREISELVGVSRITVWYWMHKKREPHYLLVDRVDRILENLEAAVAKGELPLPADVPREQRLTHIRRILFEASRKAECA